MALVNRANSGSLYTLNVATEYQIRQDGVAVCDSFTASIEPERIPIFAIKGKALSFEGKKAMLDMSGNVLYRMVQDVSTWRQNMYVVDARNGFSTLTIRKKGFLPARGRGIIQVWKGTGDAGSPWLEVVSNQNRTKAVVREVTTKKKMAALTRSSKPFNRVLFGIDEYNLKVEAGVDTALMVLLVVVHDEQYSDNNR